MTPAAYSRFQGDPAHRHRLAPRARPEPADRRPRPREAALRLDREPLREGPPPALRVARPQPLPAAQPRAARVGFARRRYPPPSTTAAPRALTGPGRFAFLPEIVTGSATCNSAGILKQAHEPQPPVEFRAAASMSSAARTAASAAWNDAAASASCASVPRVARCSTRSRGCCGSRQASGVSSANIGATHRSNASIDRTASASARTAADGTVGSDAA